MFVKKLRFLIERQSDEIHIDFEKQVDSKGHVQTECGWDEIGNSR